MRLLVKNSGRTLVPGEINLVLLVYFVGNSIEIDRDSNCFHSIPFILRQIHDARRPFGSLTMDILAIPEFYFNILVGSDTEVAEVKSSFGERYLVR